SVVLMLALEMISVTLLGTLASQDFNLAQVIVLSVRKLLFTVLMTYFFLIIVAVILSWVARDMRNPSIPLIFQLTEPVLRPFRRVIPPIAGIDLSPLFALIGIRFLILLLGW